MDHGVTRESLAAIGNGWIDVWHYHGWIFVAEDEDAACADYIAALLLSEQPNPAPFLRRVRESDTSQIFTDPAQPEFSPADLDFCTDIDRFDFAMLAEREDGLLIMRMVES
jgi:2-phosphosulfolactate phosphatase